MNRDDDQEFTHPSYGMVQFNRSSNSRGTRLFGSSLKEHYNTVRLRIGSGTLIHTLNHDRYHGSLRGEYIEVELSAAQFAEVLTTMNQGSGIPCTIRYFNGERIEDPPEIETEVERIKSSFGDSLKTMIANMRNTKTKIEGLAKSLSGKARDEIRRSLDYMIMQLESNTPFVMEMFNEASGKVVIAAKHEIDAFMQHAIAITGIEGLAAKQLTGGGDVPPVARACPARGMSTHMDVICSGMCCTTCGGPIDDLDGCRC